MPVVDIVRSEFTDPPGGTVTLVGLTDKEGPPPTAGDITAEIVMLPENPLKLDSVRLDVTAEPLVIVIFVGLAPRPKSGGGAGATVRKTCATWDSLPLAPVMFSV